MLLKLGSFDRSSLKSETQRFSDYMVCPPFCESPLKIQEHLVQLLAIRIQIANNTRSSVCGIYLPHTAVPEFIDPRFRENKPKTLVFSHWTRAFWACFLENWVYNFGHCCRGRYAKNLEAVPNNTVNFLQSECCHYLLQWAQSSLLSGSAIDNWNTKRHRHFVTYPYSARNTLAH
jgi:hypothetical protein